jgi:glutamine synthetase
MSPDETRLGRASFVDRHGLWTVEQMEAAAEVIDIARADGVEVVRFSFADQHGILRGKTIMADGVAQALESGVTMTTTLLAKDTAHKTVYPVWTDGGGFGMTEMTGGGDFVMVADPTTFRMLPWAAGTGWMLCDLYFPDGTPVPFSTRRILQQQIARLKVAGYDFLAGLEVEFHVFMLDDPKLAPEAGGQPAEPPEVSLLAHGFQYLTEIRTDEHEAINEILRRDLLALGLPLRTTEVEFGPSQFEYTFNPGVGMESADTMVLFRNAVKQICRRQGYHATFMCRPGLPNIFSSGWHLHQSLRDRETGENAFIPDDDDALLSPVGRHYVAGLLEHARASSVFTTPTVNGYKRLRPFTLAPDRAVWSRDNRGAMIRALGGLDDPASRVENRIGEPAANPYLYMASQIIAGLDGIEQGREPDAPSDTPYDADKTALPRSLMEAVAALRDDALFREKLGDQFVDYILGIKEAEIARFLSEVTDWEHREYFELF